MKRILSLLALFAALPLWAQQPVQQAQPPRTTGTITTSSSTVSAAVAGYGVAFVTVNGTYAGVTVNFEVSDDGGTTWYSQPCTRTDANVQEASEALPSNQTRGWDCGVYASSNFRVRSSAYTSGTANIGITLSAAAIEPALTVALPDPCQSGPKTFVAISVTANTQLVTGVSGKQTYICSLNLVSAAADNVALVEGTGTTCATSTAAMKGLSGGSTAATGWNFAANGGLTFGSGGFALGATSTAADNVCVFVSGATQLSGGLSYVQQ